MCDVCMLNGWSYAKSTRWHADTAVSANTAPRTQKATGVMALKNAGWRAPGTVLVQAEDGLQGGWSAISRVSGEGVFARPCPVRPRHGFVDSRRVTTIEEAQDVFRLARENDPEAELLLCQTIPADWSGIWVPGRVVVGPGNDGATSGHNSFTIPLVQPGIVTEKYMLSLSKQARITPPDVPYIEIVADTNTYPYFTQIRGGPPIEGQGPDYIPSKFTVTSVVEAKGDLLEWESLARDLLPGTAVWHPGGSMASHYAVHCVLNKIPIITSKEPKVGDTLEPTGELPPVDLQSVLRGIASATYVPVSSDHRRAAVAALLTGLHNFTTFSGQDGFWLGAATVLMHRLGSIALLGEARHANYREGSGRDNIYNEGLENPFITRRRIHRSLWMFKNHPWRGGYGGAAWYSCGKALVALDNAILDFILLAREENYQNLVGALNKAVNQAHNGGWWLNKFCETSLMDEAARGDPRAVAGGIAILGRLTQVPKPQRDEALVFWGAGRKIALPVKIRKPKVVKALVNTTSAVTQAQAKLVEIEEHPTLSYIHIQYKNTHTVVSEYEFKNLQADLLKGHDSFHGGVSLAECLKSHPTVKSLSSAGDYEYHALSLEPSHGKMQCFLPMCGYPLAPL